MKAIVKRLTSIIVCMILMTQTGCWDQKIYERIGFILQLGLELDQSDKLVYTITVPVIAPDIKGKVDVFSTSSSLLRESREKVRLVSGKAVEGGKTQHVYFSKQLAQKGINQFLDIFVRNSENPLLANVIVVDGSPKEMMTLSSKFETKPRPAFYINDLLTYARQNSYIPETRIYNFSILNYSKTIDPITPIIRYNDKEIEISGTALFKEDKMVGEIDATETGMLMALMNSDRKIQYMFHEKGAQQNPEKIKEGVAVLIKGIKRKLKINLDSGLPEINIDLNFKASLDEYSNSHNLGDTEAKKKLEEAIALSMKQDCLKLLKYLQEVGSDPLGIGEMIRAKHNTYWKSIKWEDVYKTASFNVDTKLIFQFHGAVN